MSVIDEPRAGGEAPAADDVEADYRRRLRRRRKVLVSPVVLVALVLLVPALWGAFVGLRKVSEPEAFAEAAGAVGGFTGPAKVGERYEFGITYGQLPDVTMRSTEVFVADGSVAAATTISLCRAHPGADPKSSGIGAWSGDVTEFCADLQSVDGLDLGDAGPADTLILTVVPLEAGQVHVTGFELSYDQGGRRGTEQVDVDLKVGKPA